MRTTALFIAAILAVLALAPGGAILSFAADETPALQTLDVCHASNGSMSFDLPYLLTCPCTPLPLRFAGVEPAFNAPEQAFLLAFRDERPPQSLL